MSPPRAALLLLMTACAAHPSVAPTRPIGNQAPPPARHPAVTGCAWVGHFEFKIEGDDPSCPFAGDYAVELRAGEASGEEEGRLDRVDPSLFAMPIADMLYEPPAPPLAQGTTGDGAAIVLQPNGGDCDVTLSVQDYERSTQVYVQVTQADGELEGRGVVNGTCSAAVTLTGERW